MLHLKYANISPLVVVCSKEFVLSPFFLWSCIYYVYVVGLRFPFFFFGNRWDLPKGFGSSHFLFDYVYVTLKRDKYNNSCDS